MEDAPPVCAFNSLVLQYPNPLKDSWTGTNEISIPQYASETTKDSMWYNAIPHLSQPLTFACFVPHAQSDNFSHHSTLLDQFVDVMASLSVSQLRLPLNTI
jgi:hypothetical protein